jgi:hypothetical protein
MTIRGSKNTRAEVSRELSGELKSHFCHILLAKEIHQITNIVGVGKWTSLSRQSGRDL